MNAAQDFENKQKKACVIKIFIDLKTLEMIFRRFMFGDSYLTKPHVLFSSKFEKVP